MTSTMCGFSQPYPYKQPVTCHNCVKVIKKHFSNMSFIQPKSDTYNNMLQEQTLNQDKLFAVQKERKFQHVMAAKGYNMLITIC